MNGNRRQSKSVLSAVLIGAELFAIAAAAQAYDVLKPFSRTGAYPPSSLIQATDGNLYGTTAYGGANIYGTIFKMDTSGTTLTTLHSFANTDGGYPAAGLIQATDGSLYGTTTGGGATGQGTIFKIGTNGSTLTTLHSFTGGDGGGPYAALIQGTDGNLYGTTYQGGATGEGTIFKIGTNGSTLTTLHSFAGSDGLFPYAGLIQGTDGNLYGTTVVGGVNGYGTIFKIGTNGSTLTTLHSFASSDGVHPYARVIQATDGNLYGTTYQGGSKGYGTIFKINTNGAGFTVLHNFAIGDGANPYGELIQGTGGSLFGTTFYGGASGYGTILKIDTDGTGFATLHHFVNSDGASPLARLIQGTDGNFYGTASAGGSGGGGVVFKLVLGCFFDVPPTDPFYTFICRVAADGITAGCGEGNYCPDDSVTRAQMAVFLLKAEHGSSYTPPACTGIFTDVPCPTGFAVDWIEQLVSEGITAGCGGSDYCPNDPVTRAQMAVFLLRAEHGSSYTPPACTGIFADVICTPGVGFSDWIEQLYAEAVTGGCSPSPLLYCPDNANSRGQMAVFLTKTFNLP